MWRILEWGSESNLLEESWTHWADVFNTLVTFWIVSFAEVTPSFIVFVRKRPCWWSAVLSTLSTLQLLHWIIAMCYFDIHHPNILILCFCLLRMIPMLYLEIRYYTLLCCLSSFIFRVASVCMVSTNFIHLMLAALPTKSSCEQSCN